MGVPRAKGLILVRAEVSAEELVDELTNSLDHDELAAFIKRLDEAAADYDMTKKLARHFAKAIADEDAADKAATRTPAPERGEGA